MRLAAFISVVAVLGLTACDDSAVGPTAAESARHLTGNATAMLTLSVTDPVGDHTGLIDVTRMVMDFDPVTGVYEIVIRADTAHPFDGFFRVNINLFNPDDPSFFEDTLNDFDLTGPTTSLTLSGTRFALSGWEEGDRVFTNSLAGTPNPPGLTLFRSAVNNFPLGFLVNEDFIAFADISRPAVVEVLTPQIRLQRLIADIQDLVTAGRLNQGQGNSLLSKLTAVLAKVDSGRIRPAIGQLGAFVNQVRAFMRAGILTSEEGQELIDDASAVLE